MTLQDDVYEQLLARARASGRSVKDIANEALRRGLAEQDDGNAAELSTFSSKLKIDVTSLSSTLERLEGPTAR